MTRVMKLLEEWLPLMASLAGAALPVEGTPLDDGGTPSLDPQLLDIHDYVAFQELNRRSARPRWRAARRRLYVI